MSQTTSLTANIEFRSEPQATDRAAIRAIVGSTGFFYLPEIDVAVELVDERLTKGIASGYEFVFAEEQGTLLGYTSFGPIACTQGSYDLYWIAVDAAQQRRGLGSLLLRRTEAAIAAAGGRRIYIETSDRAQYQPTRAFYERNGYTREATLIDFYAPGDDKVIYGKAVSASFAQDATP